MAGAALPVDRFAVSIAEASRLTSLSRGTIRAYAKAGKLRVTKVGRRTIIPISTLRDLVHTGIADSGKEMQ
jgi:excisionase family DNA binding protein